MKLQKMFHLKILILTYKKIIILCGYEFSKNYNIYIDIFEEMKQRRRRYYNIFSLNNFENYTLEFHKV